MKLWLALGAGTLAAAMLAGCGGDQPAFTQGRT